jgi:predicted metal-dependent enzyme (double-stranded beta helix superfamily)
VAVRSGREDEHGLARLRRFVEEMTLLIDRRPEEPEVLAEGGRLLGELIACDDWLPAAFAAADPERYQQYLLHCDAAERFCVVSFVWGPGQKTPVHDHTVWGMIGMLRGAEVCRDYRIGSDGGLEAMPQRRLMPGEVCAVSPRVGDIHEVANGLADRASISIHVYGANIGAVARHVYAPESGRTTPFVSGYANAVMPNLWDRSAEMRRRLGI